jgi:hypothetical protein
MCLPETGGHMHLDRPHKYQALEQQYVICPIVRDVTEDTGLPKIWIEGERGSGDPTWCSVWWLEEDAGAGTERGMSSFQSTTATGAYQLEFDSLSDYDNVGTTSLSAGGEGTMSIWCALNNQETIVQYRVDENQY